MKNHKVVLILLLFLSILSCKKKYDEDILGPEPVNNAKLVEPFVLSTSEADFSANNVSVSFDGKFSNKVKWKISIIGNESFAERHFSGYSDTIPTKMLWDGSQDSLYYFRANETCKVILSVDNTFNPNYITRELNNRGNIPVNDVVLASETLKIVKTKKSPDTQLEFFPSYFINDNFPSENDFEFFLSQGYVGYDQEAGIMEDKDGDIPSLGPEGTIVPKFIFNDPRYVPLSKTGGGVKGKTYYMLKGTDRTSALFAGQPDYYIGRMASLPLATIDKNGSEIISFFFNGKNLRNILSSKRADEVYLNVFVYGTGDGSTINYTIKEDKGNNLDTTPNDNFLDEEDESFEKAIKVNFVGWKLFSFKYSDFTSAPYKSVADGTYEGRPIKRGEPRYSKNATKIPDPSRLLQIQFGLIAPDKGRSGIAIIDNPVISWDGPLKY